MRYPAEIFLAQNLQPRLRKRPGVFLQRRQIALRLRFRLPVAKLTPKCRELSIHVDHNAEPTGRQQAGELARTFRLHSEPVAISECVYPKNEVKRTFQARSQI